MRCQSQTNNQAFITKDALLITEDRICKLWVEGRDSLGFLLAGLNYGDMNGAVGVTGP